MARLLPPELAPAPAVAREVGVGEQTLQRWLSDTLSRPNHERVWTASARLEAVVALSRGGRPSRAQSKRRYWNGRHQIWLRDCGSETVKAGAFKVASLDSKTGYDTGPIESRRRSCHYTYHHGNNG